MKDRFHKDKFSQGQGIAYCLFIQKFADEFEETIIGKISSS